MVDASSLTPAGERVLGKIASACARAVSRTVCCRCPRTLILGSTGAALSVGVGVQCSHRVPVLLIIVAYACHTEAKSTCRGRWRYRLLAGTTQTYTAC